jgi:hypothetical protein
MIEPAELRWPLEAHPRRDEALAYRQRVAERAFSQFREASWRERAVLHACNILERAIEAGSDQEQVNIAPVADALRQAPLIPASHKPLVTTDESENSLIFHSLIGEAAGLLLYRRTDRSAWSIVLHLRSEFQFNILQSLRTFLQPIYVGDESFRSRFDELADEIFAESLAPSTVEKGEAERSDLQHLAEQWRKAPNLREIWSGAPRLRLSWMPSEIDILSHIYLALDVRRLAELLDRFDNPYQVWAVLSGWGGLGLERSFSTWSEMFRHAQPSLEDDGRWTGKTLEPLLLTIAANAVQEARLPKGTADDLVEARGEELNLLLAEISNIIGQKHRGASLGLRWAAWLFRLSAGGGSSDEEPYPRDLRQAVTPSWRMLEALSRSEAASNWNSIAVPDAFPEEVLCLLAAKTIAADERKSMFPSIEPLLRCAPDTPEGFLGIDSISTRMLTMQFSSYSTRPDALKFRILAFLFFQEDPVRLYRDFWRRTMTIRELAEHWQTTEQGDGRSDAKQVLAMALAIGLNVVDLYADSRSIRETNPMRNSQQFGDLFRLIYDALREVQAIELFNHAFWSSLYIHLLVRRAIYENPRIGDTVISAPLLSEMEPRLSTMLCNVAGVTHQFFNGLDSLVRNGVASEKIAGALREGGINLVSIIEAAKRLNAIDGRPPYPIETAVRIAAIMNQ